MKNIKVFILLIFDQLYTRKLAQLPFDIIFREYDYYKYQQTQKLTEESDQISVEKKDTTISTAKKDQISAEIPSTSGGSHPIAVEMGSREGESGDYVRMCELPIDYIPELMRGREDYFGIWISKVALRHFESLKCRLAVDGDIFLKIERYFVPEWGEYSDKNSRVTPITNEKREELGICFSVQFTRLGFIQLHLSSGEDIEYFMTSFAFLKRY